MQRNASDAGARVRCIRCCRGEGKGDDGRRLRVAGCSKSGKKQKQETNQSKY